MSFFWLTLVLGLGLIGHIEVASVFEAVLINGLVLLLKLGAFTGTKPDQT